MNSVSEQTPVRLTEQGQKAPARRLWADLTELVKLRLTLLVLMTTLVGFLFGWRGDIDLLYLFHTLCGTFLAAAGAAARAAGTAEAAALRAREILPLPPLPPVPDMLYVETDGTGVPVRTLAAVLTDIAENG